MPVPRSNRALIFLLGIVATILLGWLVHVGAGILQPLVIALLLASMLQPVVRFAARRGIPPVLTVVLLVVLLFLGFARLGMLLQSNIESLLRPSDSALATRQAPRSSPPTARQAPDQKPEQAPRSEPAAEPAPGQAEGAEGEAEPQGPHLVDVPEAGEEAAPASESSGLLTGLLEEQERINEQVGGWENLIDKIAARITASTLPERMKEYSIRSLREIEPERIAPDLVGSSFAFSKGLLLVLIYMLFIFAEQAVFRRKILSIAGSRRNDAAEILDTIGRGIQRYLGVKTIVSLATGSLCYAALAILRVPFAPLWGFLTFALNYIPTFGSIIASAFPTITVFAIEGSWGKAMLILFIYLVVNISLGSIMEPRILGRELNLSPLVVVLSVVVWSGLWGVVGSFLAVPLTSILQIVLASQDTTRPIAVMLSSGKGLENDPPPPRPVLPQASPPAERREKTA